MSLQNITPTHQYAPGPINLQIGEAGSNIIHGQGHWTGTRTLVNYSQQLLIEVDDDLVAWSPAPREHVRIATTQFLRILDGDMTIDSPSPGVVATERSIFRFTASGLEYDLEQVYNAAAEAAGLRLTASMHGGYYGQWGINRRFRYGRDIPAIGRTQVDAGDGSWAFDSGDGVSIAENHSYTAAFTASQRSRLADDSVLPTGDLDINDRADNGTFMKFYAKCTRGGYAIKAGDRIGGTSRRTLVARRAL